MLVGERRANRIGARRGSKMFQPKDSASPLKMCSKVQPGHLRARTGCAHRCRE
jgi:hypothetical protein